MAETELAYSLDLRVPDQDNKRVPVNPLITLGSDQEADICLQNFTLAPKHCVFRVNNEVLSILNLAPDGATKIGKQELGQGKMYIIDKGDEIDLGEMSIYIRREKVPLGQGASSEDTASRKGKGFFGKLFGKEKKKEVEEEGSADESEGDKTEEGVDLAELSKEESKEEAKRLKEEEKQSKVREKERVKKEKKEEKERNKREAVRKREVARENRPGFIVRSYAFAMNLFLAYNVYKFLVPALHLDKLLKKLYAPFSVHIMSIFLQLPDDYLALLGQDNIGILASFKVFQLLMTLLVVDLLSHLLLGTSLPLFLLSVRGTGGAIANRVKGIFRALLGYLLAPFLIFDLPAIFKLRTLKELLTFSDLMLGAKSLRIFSFCVLFPAVFLSGFLAPLATDLSIFKNGQYTPASAGFKKKNKEESNLVAISHLLGLQINTFKKENLLLIPSMRLIKKKVVPQLIVFDLKKKAYASLIAGKEISIEKELAEIQSKDLLLPYLQPEFSDFSKEKENSKELMAVRRNIITNVLALSLSRFPSFIMEHGIFFGPYIDLRKKLNATLLPADDRVITGLNIGGKDYLQILKDPESPLETNHFLSLDSSPLKLFSVINKAKGSSSKNFLISKLIGPSKPIGKTMALDLNSITDWNALHSLDVFANLGMTNALDPAVFESIFEGYKALGKLTLDEKNKKFKNTYKKELNGILKGLVAGDEGTNLDLIKKLHTDIEALQKAIADSDATYFE